MVKLYARGDKIFWGTRLGRPNILQECFGSVWLSGAVDRIAQVTVERKKMGQTFCRSRKDMDFNKAILCTPIF